MSDSGTRKMLRMYEDRAGAPQYLASHFSSPPENFHSTEEVEIDVRRDGAEVAIVVVDLAAPGNKNEATRYTNKTWVPPVYKENTTLTSLNLLKRSAGDLPSDDVNFRRKVADQVFTEVSLLSAKLRRGIELMSGQVLQTGTLTLTDSAGVARFTLSFAPKSTHFPTVANDWNGGSSTKLADIESLGLVVRRDGKKRPAKLTFGRLAWQDWLADTEIQALLDNRRIDVGMVRPRREAEDAVFQGMITIGANEYEMWTYDGFYKDPQSGLYVPYVTDDNVIMTSPGARLDLTFGAIPHIPGAINPRALQYIPRRMSLGGRGIDLHTDAYFSEDGKALTVEVSARPLTIPTAIDTFGCLNTRA